MLDVMYYISKYSDYIANDYFNLKYKWLLLSEFTGLQMATKLTRDTAGVSFVCLENARGIQRKHT